MPAHAGSFRPMGGDPDVLIAVLGAGRASRFGGDKLAAPCAGRPLGRWALDAALKLGHPVVWIGKDTAPTWLGDGVRFIPNPRAADGLGSSLGVAARIAAAEGAGRLLVLLADMPLITSDLLAALLSAPAPAACAYPKGNYRSDRPGVPACLPASLFAELGMLSGERGAGTVLAGRSDVTLIDAGPNALLDVDTPAMLAQAAALLS